MNSSGSRLPGLVVVAVLASPMLRSEGLTRVWQRAIDGKSVNAPTDITNELEPHHPGDKITLGWTDTSGQTHTATVQLTSGPPQ